MRPSAAIAWQCDMWSPQDCIVYFLRKLS